jgi:fumarate reductase flavoprotein subunit
MKRAPALEATLLIYIPLLFFQFSCGTVKEKGNVEMSPDIDGKLPTIMLLGDKHEAAGIECGDCHGGSDPAARVSRTMCLECHADYKEVAASYLDPHNAHRTPWDCGACHHVHKPSEKICQGCHSFNVQAP